MNTTEANSKGTKCQRTQKANLNVPKTSTTTNSQLYVLLICVCISLCTTVIHSTVQYRIVLLIFPLTFQTITIVQMLSVGGHGATTVSVDILDLFWVTPMGGWWRWALVSPDGVAPSRMVIVSASVNLPLHHKVQKFSSGTGSPGSSRKKGHKTVVVVLNDGR